MKLAFSVRGLNTYPHRWPEPAPPATRDRVLAWAKRVGFDGIELEDIWLDFYRLNDAEVLALKRQLDAHGLPAAAFKAPGKSLCHPAVAGRNIELLRRAVEIAALLETKIVSISLPAPIGLYSVGPHGYLGLATSPGASRDASDADFEITAERLAALADLARPLGVALAIEIHQNSVADNSSGALRLLQLANRPNIGINPDLGNIYWTYAVPEERPEDAILTLAPHTIYLHCKNLRRVYVPELERAVFLRAPLADGDIDYRFAVAALKAAGYQGYLLLEGADVGDQYEWSRRSLEYVRGLLRELEE
jgi:sugar phosphate isomerase/epimerase